MSKLLIGIVFLMLAGWPSQKEYGPSAPKVLPDGNQKTKTIRIKCQPDIVIKRNDTLVIEFVQYPGRAYSWELMTADSSLLNLDLLNIARNDPADRPDSQEIVEFQFLAIKEGQEILTFKYFRPWERKLPAADSCIISVRIK